MADTYHAVRRIRSGVQVECPARLALFFQALAHDFRRIFCKACFGAHIPADGAAAFGKQFCGCIQLGIRLDQLGTLGALPARDLGDRVGGAPLVHTGRAALAGAFPALAAAPGVNFIVVAGQQHRRDGLASRTSGRVNWGYSSRPSQ